MKKYLLSCLIIVGILMVNCGQEPPEDYYQGTPEDIAAINTLLGNNSELLETMDMFVTAFAAIVLSKVEFPVSDSYFKMDSIIVKQLVDSCAFSFSGDSLGRFTDLWFTKDTTCTVTLYDTFTVISEMHFDSICFGYFFYPPGDTTTILDIVVGVDSSDCYSKSIAGEGERKIFFDVVRDTTDPDLPIIEPFEWVLKRISYGLYYFPNKGEDHPEINYVVLTPDIGSPDTVFVSQSDTLYPGHAMNRLRSVDSLLQYTSGDSVSVNITLWGTILAEQCSFFASCGGTNRVELPGGTGKVEIDGSGIVNLYIEAMLNDAYYYVIPDKGYSASVWLIPVDIQ